MPILYPASLDTLTNPTSSDTLAEVDHAVQHSNENDAIEALQAKLGIGAATPTTAGDVLTVTALGTTGFQAPSSLSKVGGGKGTVQSHGGLGTSETIDLGSGNSHAGTLDANCTLTFTGATASAECIFILELTQDATGGRTIALPASVVDGSALAAALDTAANAVTTYVFRSRDGGTTWHGWLAGGVTPASATGYSEGTSFPGSPASGDKFYRTDRNLLYFYDGTRWLTATQYRVNMASLSNTLTAGNTICRIAGPAASGYSWYLERLEQAAYVTAPNDASNYWTFTLNKWDGATGPTAIGSALSTQGLAGGQYHGLSTTSVAGVQSSTVEEFQIDVTMVGAPGTLVVVGPTLVYRLVG